MKRRSELGRVPIYGDNLRKLYVRVQVQYAAAYLDAIW